MSLSVVFNCCGHEGESSWVSGCWMQSLEDVLSSRVLPHFRNLVRCLDVTLRDRGEVGSAFLEKMSM